jgi:hypothetical protein
MNKRKNRQEQIRAAAKYTSAKNVESFEGGAKWADYNPNWQEGYPQKEENKYGLPKLYLCQILILDMTFGYRYSYRVGFINEEGKWNIEREGFIKVVRYMNIYADESDSQLIQKDIPSFNNEEKKEDEEDEDNGKDWKLAA